MLAGSTDRVIVVLEAYLDESGTHRDSSLLSVAAYVASQDDWIAFGEEWTQRLAKAKRPLFHSREPASDRLRAPLVSAIRKHVRYGVVASVSMTEFSSTAGARLRSGLGGAYSICALTCAFHIFNWMAQAQDNRLVSFVFEEGHPGLDYTLRMFAGMMRALMTDSDPRFRIAAVSAATKQDFPQLQAADFLSHVKSNNDKRWLHRLGQATELMDDQIVGRRVALISRDIDHLVWAGQKQKRQAKRKVRERG